MINTFVHLMIQKIKIFLDCQTLPEEYFRLPEFSTRQYQILQMGGRSPPLHPCLLRLWLGVRVQLLCQSINLKNEKVFTNLINSFANQTFLIRKDCKPGQNYF